MFTRLWRVAKEFILAVLDPMPPEGYTFNPNPEE